MSRLDDCLDRKDLESMVEHVKSEINIYKSLGMTVSQALEQVRFESCASKKAFGLAEKQIN